MALRLGVLAEDKNDCDAIAVVVRRFAGALNASQPRIKKCGKKGCASLRRKADPQLKLWATRGVTAAVVVHDLDRARPAELENKLEAIPVPQEISRLICIPAEELEAWLWADQAVLDGITCGAAKAVSNPHLIADPKEKLIKLSRDQGKKPRYSTNENAKWMKQLDIDSCAKRCPAFARRDFVSSVLVSA